MSEEGYKRIGNDLFRKGELAGTGSGSKHRVDKRPTTEAAEAARAMMGDMLFGAKPPLQDRPRIAIIVDATLSMGREQLPERPVTVEMARDMADAIYAKTPNAQVIVGAFRGHGETRVLKWSKPIESAAELTRVLSDIRHDRGWTQHTRALRELADKAEMLAFQQAIIISDAFERKTPLRPDGDDLVAACMQAQRLRDRGARISIGYKGTVAGACPLDRMGVQAEAAFNAIIEANGSQGYVFLFGSGYDSKQHFENIATMASLQTQGDQIGVQRMLEYVQTIPFEMQIGEMEPSEHCKAQAKKSEAKKSEG